MLRTSSYTIYADLPDDGDNVLLVHGYTGAYDKVSKNVANYVRSLDTNPVAKPLYGEWTPEPALSGKVAIQQPTDETINVLKKRGYLTEMNNGEELAFFTNVATRLHHFQSKLMPSYIIMPTYSCNLRCPYCFQDHMRTDPKFKHLLRIMKPDMADRIFKAMPGIEESHGVLPESSARRNVIFFGGEPLLEATRPIVEYFIHKAQSLGGVKFSAVSNATDLHHYKELLGPEKIAFIQVTIDGIPEEHDKRRIYADGSGSFEKIADNISMALDLGTAISVRMNIDRNNVGVLPQLAATMIQRGWTGYKHFSSYTAPITPVNGQAKNPALMSSWHLDKALDEMREHHENMWVIGRPDDGLTQTIRQIFEKQHAPLPNLKASFCGAHNKMYIFDPFGDIYACWEYTGNKNIRMGYIDEDGEAVMNDNITKTWRERTVVSNPTCSKCRYALYCGGGCAILANGQHGTLYANHCDGFQMRFRSSVADAYGKYASGILPIVEQERVCDM
jgi:uncharacterized protein